MTTTLPDAARAAWWLSAWLRGDESPDGALASVIDDDALHQVVGLPGEDGPLPLALALGALRRLGVAAIGLALPAEGDPVGLGGPRGFNDAALEAGEAAVLVGADLGLVPERTGRAVEWRCLPAGRRQLPDVGEADRLLRATLIETATALARLDVARWSPELADELIDLRAPRGLDAPRGTPQRCVALAGRGLWALDLVELALTDDGGAITAAETTARREALVPLAAAGRRALVAACSPEVWPPPGADPERR